jgi:hypothetical protein
MMVTYVIAILLICILIVLSCLLSVTLSTKRTFKKYQRPFKRSRGAEISSPFLQDAIFAVSEKYKSFWVTEIEVDPDGL